MMRTAIRVLVVLALGAVVLGGWSGGLPASQAQGVAWTVSVYDNPDLVGSPRYVTTVSAINFLWPAAPVINGVDTAAYGVPPDRFSVRLTTNAFFTAGTYRFTVQVDDGARVFVDGAALINQWTGGALRTFQADAAFATDGNHSVTVEMFDSTLDAALIFNWALASGAPLPTAVPGSGAGAPWYGEYFNGLDLTAPAIYTATYAASGLNLNWGQGSPAGSVPADNFSARFVRTLSVPQDIAEGMYRFYARADDNFRFRIDSTIIIDQWDTFAGSQVYTADVPLLVGPHTFTFEYRERTADASLYLTWSPPNAQNPVLPPPSGAPEPEGGGGGAVPSGVTGTVNVYRLNFRQAPSPTAQILARLNRGSVYAVTGRTADNRWARIDVNGTQGWVYRIYLTISGDFNSVPLVDTQPPATPAPPPPTGIIGRALGNLRMINGPGGGAAQIGVLPMNTEVQVLGKDRGHAWYLINYNGLVGWVYAPYVRLLNGVFDQLPYADGTQPPYDPAPATQGVVVQAYGNMAVRSGPGVSYPKIGRVVWGSRVQLLAVSPNRAWYKIRSGDLVGWSFAPWYRLVQGSLADVPTASS